MPLLIAARMPLPDRQGPNVQDDWAYWQDEIQPLLKGRHVELLGELADRDKDEFLRNAAALLFPIRWPEPFGLVMVEALACGTPVLALNDGSVPEVIHDGVTGFMLLRVWTSRLTRLSIGNPAINAGPVAAGARTLACIWAHPILSARWSEAGGTSRQVLPQIFVLPEAESLPPTVGR